MDNFWDRFVYSVYAALVEEVWGLHPRAAVILNRAHDLRLLDVAGLNDLSVLLVALLCSDDGNLARAARQEVVNRGLHANPIQQASILLGAVRPNLKSLQILAHFTGPAQRSLVGNVLHTLYVPPMVEFLSRTAMLDVSPDAPNSARSHAEPVYRWALDRLDYETIVHGDFADLLYSRLFELLARGNPLLTVAPTITDPPPDWTPPQDSYEWSFLDVCLRELGPWERFFLYLTIYANLNLPQIVRDFSRAAEFGDVNDVADFLVYLWDRVLSAMAADGE